MDLFGGICVMGFGRTTKGLVSKRAVENSGLSASLDHSPAAHGEGTSFRHKVLDRLLFQRKQSLSWCNAKNRIFMTSLSIRVFTAALVILPFAPSFTAEQPAMNAKEQLRKIRAELKEEHSKGDAAAYLASAHRLSDLLNGSPSSLLQLMSAENFAGDRQAALDSFDQFVRMGQSNEEVLKLKQIELIRNDPRFREIHANMIANTTAKSRASKVFSLEDSGLIPEDIDYDPATESFYITSVLEKKILVVTKSGSTKVFALAPDQWPMMALKIDWPRHVLWATEVALDGFVASPAKGWGRSAILTYDLGTGKLLHRIEGPAHSSLGDMTLTAKGDAIISDGEGGRVYRVDRRTQQIERLDAGDFISPQTPAMSPDGRRIFVPDYLRGIGILDLETKHVSWISMQGAFALSGIDGLYLDGHTLIATQNGTSPERVVEFKVDPSLSHIESESTIERATPALGDPTHGVVVDGYFFYLANSGWDALDDHGNRRPDAKASPPSIMRAKLGN